MFFWPKKILTLFFLPLHFALFAGCTGLILLHLRRRERLARILLTAAIAALALFSNKSIANALIRPLENRYAAIPECTGDTVPTPELATCRYVAVLGGGHSRSPSLSRINQLSTASLSRLAEAIRIFRQLPAGTRLVVSGHDGDGRISHAQVLAEAAVSLGVAPSDIVRLDTPRDTHDEAVALRALAGDTPVAIVTSAWHLPRAMNLCAGAGLHAVGCPSDFLLRPEADQSLNFFRFELASLERSTKAIHEYLGLTWAFLRGQR